MTIHIAATQMIIHQYQRAFNQEAQAMFQNDHRQVPDRDILSVLQQLISQRSSNLKRYIQLAGYFAINYYVHTSYGQMETMNTMIGQRKETRIERIGFFLSKLFVETNIATATDIRSLFVPEQLRLLNRRHAYVSPCQTHQLFPSSACPTQDEMVIRQYAPLRHQLVLIFQKYHIDISRSTNFQSHAFEAFKSCFTRPLSNDLCQHVHNEKQLIQSIRHSLHINRLLMRRIVNQTNVF